jgi:OHCU decarboxylase
MDLSIWNELPVDEARRQIANCCGSKRWTDRMVSSRPYDSVEDVLAEARDVWWSLEPEDWMEAFGILPSRLKNDLEAEVLEAAKQQAEITALKLEAWLN